MAAEDKKIKNRIVRQVNSREKLIEAFVNRLDNFLGKNIQEIIGTIEIGKARGQEVASMLGALMPELQSAGLEKEISKIRELYADELQFISDEFEELDQKDVFSSADTSLVEALIDNGINKISTEATKHGLDIQAEVMQSVLVGKELTAKEIRERGLPATIKTELNTALMVFNRTVSQNKADELGFKLFLYVGPDDKITRPFCKNLLDKNPPIYTAEEINAMNNGQGLNVRTAGGGYNCRHHWSAVSEELAKSLGYGN